MEALAVFPPELRQVKPQVDAYVYAKLRQFGTIVCRRLNPTFTKEQVDSICANAMQLMSQQDAVAQPPRNLRLVIRHDCQSTGCGDVVCGLCQYNPSRLCTRNVKQKYLIDDHLKAKCSAPLRVELVDDSGACHSEGLPPGVQLEMHVLNGEKYKELCPDNTLLSTGQIKNCIILHHQKALLKREGMSDDQLRVMLPLERGQAAMSDLALTTSSEALLSGKAPTFRLLVWAVDASGEPVPYVTYVVSESFVVATKRVKHAIKSDIPSVADHISKLLHVGKATVDKLVDLRAAFVEEGFDVPLPDELARVDRVGQFKQLVELSENNNDLKGKLRHVLKLSPEKWDEVCQHALCAVVPDFRNRVWWCGSMQLGLLYACKNGAVMMDQPIGVVKLGPADTPHTIVPVQSLSPQDFNALPKLKQQALQSWYLPNHPSWGIYGETGAADGPAPSPPPPQQQQQQPQQQPALGGGMGMGMGPAPGGGGGPGGSYLGMPQSSPPLTVVGPGGPYGDAGGGGFGDAYIMARGSSGGMPAMGAGPGGGSGRNSNSSPFALGTQQGPPHGGQQQQQGPHSGPSSGSGRDGGPGASTSGHLLGAAPMGQHHPQQQQGGGGHLHPHQQQQQQLGAPQPSMRSSPASAFFNYGHMSNLVGVFPDLPLGGQGGGSASAARSASGLAAEGPVVFPAAMGGPGGIGAGTSLEMLKTDDLLAINMGRGHSMGFPSLNMGPLAGAGDSMRSLDWLGTLPGAGASYTMLDVAPPPGGNGGPGDGGGGHGHHGGHGMLLGQGADGTAMVGDGGGHGQGHSHHPDARRLSMKLNSMSLDLDKVIAEHAGS